MSVPSDLFLRQNVVVNLTSFFDVGKLMGSILTPIYNYDLHRTRVVPYTMLSIFLT